MFAVAVSIWGNQVVSIIAIYRQLETIAGSSDYFRLADDSLKELQEGRVTM
jgi:hypothetical protein